ncbi:MAG: hypothetical protein AAF198_02930 [Pseudomonadota bacterium]
MSMEREELEAMLVFLANDTLEGDERLEVETAVAADPNLAEELKVLKGIRATMQAEDDGIQTPGEFGLARLKRDIKASKRMIQPAQSTGLWRIAAVVAVGLFAAQTLFLVSQPGVEDYILAGEEQRLEFALQAGFVGTATEADIRELLLDAGLVIVDGPSAIGIYTLSAPDADAQSAALERLQNRPELVEFAEELQ